MPMHFVNIIDKYMRKRNENSQNWKNKNSPLTAATKLKKKKLHGPYPAPCNQRTKKKKENKTMMIHEKSP